MSASFDEKTQMMAHWRATKARHPNAILLYRVGDFYATFEDDAALQA